MMIMMMVAHACMLKHGQEGDRWVGGRAGAFFFPGGSFLIPIPGYRLMGIDRGVYPYFMRVSSI